MYNPILPRYLSVLQGPGDYQAWLTDLQLACYPGWLWPLMTGDEPIVEKPNSSTDGLPYEVRLHVYESQQRRLRDARELLVQSVGSIYRRFILPFEDPAKAMEALDEAIKWSQIRKSKTYRDSEKYQEENLL